MPGGFSRFSWRNFDWLLLGAIFSLVLLGLAAIYSVDLSRGIELAYFRKQAMALGVGLCFLIWAATRQRGFFRSYAKWFYLASLILLVAVLFFGTAFRGTRGWFNFGGFSFQPVELAKCCLILILAYVISRFGRRFERPLFFFGTCFITLLAVALVLLQPDLGSAIVLGLIWFGLMLMVRARKLYVGILIGLVIIGSVGSWFLFLAPYQKERILTFVNPERDPLGTGYNVTQSVIAIGAGKFFGRGLGFGSQSQLRFLPEAQTDFVFSVIGEELGFAGTTVMFVLFGLIFWRLLKIIRTTDDDFSAAVVSGVLILFFSQAMINIGANVGLLPVTGITLPFVSYGGSSLVASLLMIGVVTSVAEKKY